MFVPTSARRGAAGTSRTVGAVRDPSAHTTSRQSPSDIEGITNRYRVGNSQESLRAGPWKSRVTELSRNCFERVTVDPFAAVPDPDESARERGQPHAEGRAGRVGVPAAREGPVGEAPVVADRGVGERDGDVAHPVMAEG